MYVHLVTLTVTGCPAVTDGLDGNLARLQQWPRREDGRACTARCGAQPVRRAARVRTSAGRVVIQDGGVVVARQVRRDRLVPPNVQLRLCQVPEPGQDLELRPVQLGAYRVPRDRRAVPSCNEPHVPGAANSGARRACARRSESSRRPSARHREHRPGLRSSAFDWLYSHLKRRSMLITNDRKQML